MTSPSKPSSRAAWLLLALVLAGAFASTFGWLGGEALPGAGRAGLALAMLAVCATTLVNLALRWLRWHFLLRTLGLRLRTRESAVAFTALLPMILTPWACGELLLFAALRRLSARPLRHAALVWLGCRGADALALGLLLVAGPRGLLLPALLALLVPSLGLAAAERLGPAWRAACRLVLFAGLSLAAWSVAALGLHLALLALHAGPAWGISASAFAQGTLAGSLSGLPAGIAVTGAAMIRVLGASGLDASVALWSVAAVRWGGVGFAAALGLACAALGRGTLRSLVTGRRPASQGHFDGLAEDYAAQIPAHVRDRLIETKTQVMLRILRGHGVPAGARGLDIGCGQGWYTARLAREGFAMAGCDLTAGQVELARAHCAALGVPAELHVAGADALPFPDNSLDFAYTINVFHHITDPATLARALRDVTRALKPGAPLIVFEMNTLNPLFRLYMSYVFPFIREIDDGTEVWLTPGRLPAVPGSSWSRDVDYITFVPDFLPGFLLRPLAPLESLLERSPFRHFSAHFAIRLVKDRPPAP